MAPDLIITRARLGGGVVVAARGVVDVRTIARLQLALAEAARQGEALTIDLTGVEVHSAAGRALLLNAVRRVHSASGRLRVVCPPGPFRAALEQTGLARQMNLVGRLDAEPATESERGAPDNAGATSPRGGRRRRDLTPERRSVLLADATLAIEAHYADPELRLDQIAHRIATSRRQLQRVLAELAGTTFRGELHAVRMQHAAELLQTSQLRVHEIAARVGHRQPAQFANAFRRYHGLQPTALRRAARRRNRAAGGCGEADRR